MMRDAQVPQFSKDSFVKDYKMLKDTDPFKKSIKFGPEGVTVNKDNEMDSGKAGNDKTVSQMAKRATKIGS